MVTDHAAIAESRSDLAEVRDGDLLAQTREGDPRAYAELWERYAPMATAVARSSWWSSDPEDLVAESFTRVFQAIRSGKGPTTAFKPYLFATMRNLAITWGRSRREVPLEHMEAIEDPRTSDAAADADFDADLVARALVALPSRWQDVLWLAEVEGLSMLEIGARLGISERASAVLAFRAREGLRQAWITAHLAEQPPTAKDCRWTLNKLGAHTRRRLTARDDQRVQAHLDRCDDCGAKAEEARRASSRIFTVLVPGGIGVGVAVQAWQSLTEGGSASAMPTSVMAASVGAPVTVALPAGGFIAAKAGLVAVAATAVATVTVSLVAASLDDPTEVVADAAVVAEGGGAPAPEASRPSTAPPSRSSAPTPTASAAVPTAAPETEPAAPAPPVSAPAPIPPRQTIAAPASPVILSLPSEIARNQVLSFTVRCEPGAALTVSAWDVTIAAGTCGTDQRWQGSVDVSAYPVPSGTEIILSFAQSNAAGVSATASAGVLVMDAPR
ncbi:sigma-70 family RNA polymerase sigma factor [Microbacterium sp. CH1]|uniref:sigma-70 family RNA polymerase sigma factor n=1 Tax=Microbacterium sp. CH1 TaxID=1770208 RepID=UPI0007899D63|nr:sigma-70 family RNA polymerase sigma factor [Microbacterium sp. CH1]KYJ96753.1 hypothetical protein AUV07_03030 [Microbacterium sp. CH1]